MAASTPLVCAINLIFSAIPSLAQADDVDCSNLNEVACRAMYDPTTGDPYCAYNRAEERCYSITRALGDLGAGTYDDGYQNAAKAADANAQSMQTMIAVFGVLIGLLFVLGIALGVYFYRKRQEEDEDGVSKQHSEKAFGSPAKGAAHKKVNYVDEDEEMDL